MSRIREGLLLKHFKLREDATREVDITFTVTFEDKDIKLAQPSDASQIRVDEIDQLIESLKKLQQKVIELDAVNPKDVGGIT